MALKATWFWQRSVSFASALVLLMSGSVYAAAEQSKTPEISLYIPQYSQNGGIVSAVENPKPQEALLPLVEAGTLPSAYSSRAEGYVERVENQGTYDLCWAFVQNTLAAINVKKDEGKVVDYSESHIAYSTSSEYNNPYGFIRELDAGGSVDMAIAYLSRGSGMVSEEEFPFFESGIIARSPEEIDGYFSTGYLEEAPILNRATLRQVKELIYEYGAAGTGIYYDDLYMNKAENLYCCPVEKIENHEITLIGWDDAAECFLAVNSWGTEWGQDGYFAISYEDKQLYNSVYALDYKSGDLPYDGIRSYNDFGKTSFVESGKGEALYYSTTYDTGDAKTLEGIGAYIIAPDTKLEIYVNPYNGDGKAEEKFKKIHEETFDRGGYYHISFDQPLYLYGSQFNVKLKVTSAKGGSAFGAAQINVENYLSNSVFEKGRSYYGGNDGRMYLLEECFNLEKDLIPFGWVWSMQAFTISDLSLSAQDGAITFEGEEYLLTLKSTVDSTPLKIKRGGKILDLYGDQSCRIKVEDKAAALGSTYYFKLGNGTHIRRTVRIAKSTIPAFSRVYKVEGLPPNADQPYTFYLSGNVFSPKVETYSGEEWALYGLPDGVGWLGKSFSPKVYRSVIYLRIFGKDGISATDYPIILYGNKCSAAGFKDWGKVSSWAKEGLTTTIQYGLMSGDGKGYLTPKNDLTRAQAASMLVRAAGIESGAGPLDCGAVFSDVGLTKWYAPPISTAAYIQMISGHNDPGYRCFSPNKKVTREQYASMIIRMLAFLEGVDTAEYLAQYLPDAERWLQGRSYADMNRVSSWAKETVKVALYLGVFNGSKDGGKLYINPKDNITREQAALIIANSLKIIQK